MNLNVYRNSESEKKRIADLMGLLPDSVVSVLDIGPETASSQSS